MNLSDVIEPYAFAGSAGILYAGKSNVNKDVDTGIRYGVIPIHEVLQAWADSSEPRTPYVCSECYETIGFEYKKHCFSCGAKIDEDEDFAEEPTCWVYKHAEYAASQSGDDVDIFIIKSPFVTYAQFCSPCAPGACYLKSPLSGNIDCMRSNCAYCFGHDWFEGGVAPYPVYGVMAKQRIFSQEWDFTQREHAEAFLRRSWSHKEWDLRCQHVYKMCKFQFPPYWNTFGKTGLRQEVLGHLEEEESQDES